MQQNDSLLIGYTPAIHLIGYTPALLLHGMQLHVHVDVTVVVTAQRHQRDYMQVD